MKKKSESHCGFFVLYLPPKAAKSSYYTNPQIKALPAAEGGGGWERSLLGASPLAIYQLA